MSKLKLEEEVAAVLSRTRANPTSLIPALEDLNSKFMGNTPIVSLTATRRLRVPEGKDAVDQAIGYLQERAPESELQYSWGMSEAARGKYKGGDSLTDRLKAKGQWSGTCSDFVQLGVEDLDAETIVCLMVISAGDPNRQIRERVFSTDKHVVGVAIGSYKQSTAVAVALATKFVANGFTEEEEQKVRGRPAHEPAVQANSNVSTISSETIAAMHEASKPNVDDDATEEELERRRREHIASLENQKSPRAVSTYEEEDEQMAAIQRERLAALAALERGNQYQGGGVIDNSPIVQYDEPNARDFAVDGSESFEEAEAKKRAFLEEQERQKKEAIEKAEELRKNAWKAERAAREAQKKKEEEERIRRLNEGGPNFRVGPRPQGANYNRPAQKRPYKAAAKAAPVVNRAPPAQQQYSNEPEEMDELQKERMAKIAALEQNNPYARTGMDAVAEEQEHVGQPAPGLEDYDPTRETFEQAEARKRAFFEEQERLKREAMEQAEQTRKNAWKAERAAREAQKKKEEEERLARLQEEGYGKPRPAVNRVASRQAVNPAPAANREVVRGTPASSSYGGGGGGGGGGGVSPRGFGSGGGGDDDAAKEEERLMRMMEKKTGVASFGRVDPMASKEAERKRKEEEALERAAKVKALREEKWKEETRKAEEAAKRRAEEAEAKARALQMGTMTPDEAHVPHDHIVDQHHQVQQEEEVQQEEVEPEVQEEEVEQEEVEQEVQQEEVEPEVQQEEVEEQEVQQEEVEPEAQQEEEPDFGLGDLPGQKGDVEESIAELENCNEDNPCVLYLNALLRNEESTQIGSLNDVRDDVTYYTSSGHKCVRSGKYFVSVFASEEDEREIRIPPSHMLDDDFNAISDYFFFGTAEYLTLYPDENLNEEEMMEVNDLTTLSPGVPYYLPSGNFVEIIGGENPQFLLDGNREVALPEEIAEQLRY